MTQKRTDPVIDAVCEIRQNISVRFGHDLTRLVAYNLEWQERHRDRMIDRPKTHDRGDEFAA